MMKHTIRSKGFVFKDAVSRIIVASLLLLPLKIVADEGVGPIVGEIIPIGKIDAVTISDENSGDGGTSYQLGGTGLITDGEMAGIEFSVAGPGVLSFNWKVSSEADWDVLSFYEVGVGATNQISGVGGDWVRISVAVPAEPETVHTFRWEYKKDPFGDYVGEDCGWVDAVNWALHYALTVYAGTGDGMFTNGTSVEITADAPALHLEFKHWTGDTDTVDDVFASTTTLVMPAANTILKAAYTPILYPLDVTHGSGGGSYSYNSTIQIGATPYAGKNFHCWTGNVDTVSNIHAATTTVRTTDYPLSLAATYSVPLTVNAGSGSGWYLEDSQVTLTADPAPMYMEFSGWTGAGVSYLDDPSSRITKLTVPDGGSAITANYTMAIDRVAGCYGRSFIESGVEGGITMDDTNRSPSDTPVIRLGGSGIVPDNGFAAFETEVWGSGSIMFNWCVSSEKNADYLKFFVDDVEVNTISGTRVPWTQVSNRVEGASVNHTLRWEYSKNDSLSSTTDAGWVDDIVWISDYPVPVRSPDIIDIVIEEQSHGIRFFGEHGVHYTAYSNATLTAEGWTPIKTDPLAFGEFNGVSIFEAFVEGPLTLQSCFFRIGVTKYTIIFVNWDNTVLKTEEVTQGASATAPKIGLTRPSDDTYDYTFIGWDFSFNNVQSDLTVKAEYKTMPIPEGMVRIPGGTNSGTDPDFGAYSLTVDAFYMDPYEVTKSKWDEVYTWAVAHGYSFDNAGSGKAANHPVHTVNWYDCVKWCNARSQKEGRPAVYTVGGAVYKTGQSDNVVQTSATGYRLPTDTEWEYAARGGLSGKRFPWGDTIQHSRANYYSKSSYSYDTSPTRGYHPTNATGGQPYTSPVGVFAPNDYGLYDMAGNVFEWCFDRYPDEVGSYRVLRGGGWGNYYAYYCRAAFRFIDRPVIAHNGFGFRAVLPPGQ